MAKLVSLSLQMDLASPVDRGRLRPNHNKEVAAASINIVPAMVTAINMVLQIREIARGSLTTIRFTHHAPLLARVTAIRPGTFVGLTFR